MQRRKVCPDQWELSPIQVRTHKIFEERMEKENVGGEKLETQEQKPLPHNVESNEMKDELDAKRND